MKKLGQILKQYNDAQAFAEMDLSEWDPRTLPGAQMRKRECQEMVVKLKQEYGEALREKALTVFVLGDDNDVAAFAMTSEEEIDTIAVEADSLYKKLADDIEPSMSDARRLFGTSQYTYMLARLNEIAKEMDFGAIPVTEFDITPAPLYRDLVNTIRDLVRKSVGDRLNAIYMEREVIEKALAIRYSHSVPVLVLGATEAEITGGLPKLMFTGTTFTITVNQESAAPEACVKIFTDIRSELKKSK